MALSKQDRTIVQKANMMIAEGKSEKDVWDFIKSQRKFNRLDLILALDLPAANWNRLYGYFMVDVL